MTKYYKIHGYDNFYMEDYIKPKEYSTYKEAFAKCKMNNEYVKAYDDTFEAEEYIEPDDRQQAFVDQFSK